MIRALIVDDEFHACETLAMKLDAYCSDVHVLAMLQSAPEAVGAIRNLKPDLVFMDIAMPDCDGFALLDTLGEIDFQLIFVTAFKEYAISAIRRSAVDYLVKPVVPLDLQAAVSRVAKAREQQARHDEALLAFPNDAGLEFHSAASIVWCKADSNYTRIALSDGSTSLVARTLGEIEDMLEPFTFFRVHHSYIINLAYMHKYHKGRGGFVELKNGKRIAVAARKRDAFLTRLSAYCGRHYGYSV